MKVVSSIKSAKLRRYRTSLIISKYARSYYWGIAHPSPAFIHQSTCRCRRSQIAVDVSRYGSNRTQLLGWFNPLVI